jgi:hypothetical protein
MGLSNSTRWRAHFCSGPRGTILVFGSCWFRSPGRRNIDDNDGLGFDLNSKRIAKFRSGDSEEIAKLAGTQDDLGMREAIHYSLGLGKTERVKQRHARSRVSTRGPAHRPFFVPTTQKWHCDLRRTNILG